MGEAERYLSGSEAYKRDPTKNDYRTPDELRSINSSVSKKADEMSVDFVDELNAKGIVTPDDFDQKSGIVESVLVTYRERLIKWLQEQ
jgi:hypothetical protein